MSILLYDQQQLMGCISEVQRIEARVNSSKKKEEEEQQEREEVPATTLDSYFVKSNANYK